MAPPTLAQAIATIKAGRRAEARALLEQILATEPRNVDALLWMTEVSKTPEERRKYLNQILAIDPNNLYARKGLELLGKADEQSTRLVTDQLPTNSVQPKPKTSASVATKTGWTGSRKILLSSIIVLVIFVSAAVVISLARTQIAQSNTVGPVQSPRPPSTKRSPTSTPNPWPELSGMKAYPEVEGLDLVKRAYYYKDKPICLFGMTAFNVREDRNGTTFMIQNSGTWRTSGDFSIIGTVYYPGSLTGLVDNWLISLSGYVVGTEADLNISSSSRPAILMQRGAYYDPDFSKSYSTHGDSFSDCAQ